MELIILFFVAAIALVITPGPDSIYVMSRGIGEGRYAGFISALGVSCGLLFHTLGAALGLAILLQTSIYAFWAIKILGGIYIIYLGIKILKSKESINFSLNTKPVSVKKCFTQGFLTNVLNPKVALFFVAFLPQFISIENPNYSLYIILMGCAYAILTIIYLGTLGISAGLLGTFLKKNEKISNGIRWFSGLVIVSLGIKILLPERT